MIRLQVAQSINNLYIFPPLQLFDHIAECMANFIKERELGDEVLPLGFTFSFPCKQEGLTKARLACWTKGFKCAGVEGNDVVELLKQAIARRGVSFTETPLFVLH